ncbi:S8 family serine peptidase [Mucilaginibacter sp.]|uniref:S8 family peptidase n=1 Tax=Mucilaginibacter sp. TaxID=1882438 RepID=UPI0026128481|nr:S8 family serine peptidase [Mucilaginibacter sp.]MDB4922899.1 hypothetical protein [Mucilaginibacter sp.]
MKVTVKDKYLNVRVGKPLLSAPSYQYIAPGSQIEVDGKLYPGDPYEGNANWLKDAANNYYWAGGVSGLPGAVTTVAGKTTYGWFNRLNIAQVWKDYSTQGSGVKVAVLDSGYSVTNADLKGKITAADTRIVITGPEYSATSLKINDESKVRHGTRCASLIGAANTKASVVGIAPGCELLIAKTSVDREFLKKDYLLTALDWAIGQGAEIISASLEFDLSAQEILSFDQHIRNTIGNKQVLLFAAAGNTSGISQRIINYPANLKTFVSVGATTESGILSPITALNDVTTIHAPGERVESYGPGEVITPDDGTSFSTPIVAGVAALAVSYLKTKNGTWNSADLLTQIYATGDRIPGEALKKLINPVNLFKSF